jgi:hypothetical protein
LDKTFPRGAVDYKSINEVACENALGDGEIKLESKRVKTLGEGEKSKEDAVEAQAEPQERDEPEDAEGEVDVLRPLGSHSLRKEDEESGEAEN